MGEWKKDKNNKCKEKATRQGKKCDWRREVKSKKISFREKKKDLKEKEISRVWVKRRARDNWKKTKTRAIKI